MGLKGKYIGYRLLVECDEQGCNVSCTYFADNLTQAIKKARASGWAISKDKRCTWCANCAEKHRHVGRNGYRPRKP